jgi:chromosome segregation ATPase
LKAQYAAQLKMSQDALASELRTSESLRQRTQELETSLAASEYQMRFLKETMTITKTGEANTTARLLTLEKELDTAKAVASSSAEKVKKLDEQLAKASETEASLRAQLKSQDQSSKNAFTKQTEAADSLGKRVKELEIALAAAQAQEEELQESLATSRNTSYESKARIVSLQRELIEAKAKGASATAKSKELLEKLEAESSSKSKQEEVQTREDTTKARNVIANARKLESELSTLREELKQAKAEAAMTRAKLTGAKREIATIESARKKSWLGLIRDGKTLVQQRLPKRPRAGSMKSTDGEDESEEVRSNKGRLEAEDSQAKVGGGVLNTTSSSLVTNVSSRSTTAPTQAQKRRPLTERKNVVRIAVFIVFAVAVAVVSIV